MVKKTSLRWLFLKANDIFPVQGATLQKKYKRFVTKSKVFMAANPNARG